jgi:hypothetical protein
MRSHDAFLSIIRSHHSRKLFHKRVSNLLVGVVLFFFFVFRFLIMREGGQVFVVVSCVFVCYISDSTLSLFVASTRVFFSSPLFLVRFISAGSLCLW